MISNSHKKNILVVDSIGFPGGSKFATKRMLSLLNKEHYSITVYTADPLTWKDSVDEVIPLIELEWLNKRIKGYRYFIRHMIIMAGILRICFFQKKIHILLGASGPGIDLSIYLAKEIIKCKTMQLIHGPVAKSKTIAQCLLKADQVHYLESTKDSLTSCLSLKHDHPEQYIHKHFHSFRNGLLVNKWPTRCKAKQPSILWAASLLKWKGIDLLIETINLIPLDQRPQFNICYIEPKNAQCETSHGPCSIEHVTWFKSPDNIDDIRSQSSIFVSTSEKEPFGLSILEALASGLCVIIPKDGAYWDRKLSDNENCLKYTPNNADDLKKTIISAYQQPDKVRAIGRAGCVIAKTFKAHKTYSKIITSLDYMTQVKEITHTQESKAS